MATANEIINLILQVAPQGKQGAIDLKDRLVALRAELHADVTAMDALDAATINSNTATQAKVRELRALQKQINVTADATQKSAASSAHFGRSMINAGQMVQDFHAAGFMGISNQLDRLALSLGLSGGVAGAVMMLGTAWMVWGPQVTSWFTKLLGYSEPAKLFADRIDELNNKIKDLEGKDVKVRADFEEIKKAKEEVERLTKAAEAMRSILSEQSEAERESGAAVRKAIVETPGGQEALAAARKRAQQEATEAERAREGKASDEMEVATALGMEASRQMRIAVKAGTSTTRAEVALTRAVKAYEAAEKAKDKATQDRIAAEEQADKRFNESMLAPAEKGQGFAQVQAQQQLAQALAAQGPAGQQAAEAILENNPAAVAQRKAEEKAAQDRKGAQREAEQAQREAEQAQAELDRMANEADRRQKEEDEEVERFNKDQAKEQAEKAKQFAPVFDDALQEAITANELAQAQGGGFSDQQAAARLKADVARRLQGAPGIANPAQATDVAGAIVADAIQSFTQRQFEVQQQTLLQQRQMMEMMTPMQQQIFILQRMLQANQAQMGRLNANDRTRQMFGRVPGGG